MIAQRVRLVDGMECLPQKWIVAKWGHGNGVVLPSAKSARRGKSSKPLTEITMLGWPPLLEALARGLGANQKL